MAGTEGIQTWDQVVQQLTDAECVWQDLDGLHVGAPPTHTPHTSIVWAWTIDHSTLWRIRLNSHHAYVALHHPTRNGIRLAAWAPGDGRVAQFFAQPGHPDLENTQWVQFTEPLTANGSIPVSFIAAEPRTGQPT